MALRRLHEVMGKLKLTVNEEKTRICKVPEGTFDFLGYTCSGDCIRREPARPAWGYRPSKNSIKRVVEKVHELTPTLSSGSYRTHSRPSRPAQRLVVSPKKRSLAFSFFSSCWRTGSRQFI
jgi:hypothetical protein